MKKVIILSIISTLFMIKGFTQADSAMLYLTGTFKKYNPAKSLALFRQRADSGEAKAMNAVALHYAKGLGTAKDATQAAFWFRKAALSGYTKSWVNLGMLYKHHSTDSAGYAVALKYFDTAVNAGEPSAFFAKGYMYYKGLGCTQSYDSALTLFGQGIALDRPECMYFTGLCYKYGYGVTVSADSATKYIDKAARRGYKQANAELASAGNYAGRGTKGGIKTITLQQAVIPHKAIQSAETFIDIEGAFTGMLTQYDYSGKLILAQMPLSLKLAATGNRLSGKWQQGTNEAIEVEAIQDGNTIVFSSGSFLLHTVRANSKKQKLVFKSARFEKVTAGDSLVLTGTVQLFNTYTRETEKPLSVKLVQKQPQAQYSALESGIKVYPNPVSKSFAASFSLPTASEVKVAVYNTQGQLVYLQPAAKLAAGKQTINISHDLKTAGIYIVKIDAAGFHKSVAFIKE